MTDRLNLIGLIASGLLAQPNRPPTKKCINMAIEAADYCLTKLNGLPSMADEKYGDALNLVRQ